VIEGIKTLSWRSLFMLEANVLDKVSPGSRGHHFFGGLFMLTGQCYSLIHLKAGTS
jgi:hypothetical protein